MGGRVSGRRLWLVRHPRTLAPTGVCYGASDVPLDPRHLADVLPTLAAQLPPAARWRVSPLARARGLADALQQRMGLPHAPSVDPRLAEMHFGRWEMQAWEAIGPADLQAWTDDFVHYRCGGLGESVHQFLHRVSGVWNQCHEQGEGDEVWITHAGVIRAIQLLQRLPPPAWAGLQAADWPRETLPFGALRVWTI